MADLSITAASVKPGAVAQIQPAVFGETVAAGQVVYLNQFPLGDGLWYLAINTVALNSSGNHTYGTMGIALVGGAVGQEGNVVYAGGLLIGASVAVGVRYYLSATAGGITATVAASGHEAFSLCYADTTSTVIIDFKDQGTVA